ncbi:ABC transporter ATP-binding protein [Tannockella kyphosi]|uniref:ABC transporter ATP-binding protein n=1 Tax=Tannockella kyphosi TaxID=2899121 RepID=UPI002013AC2A|nr:ABC transporter ATP-binding protein [Tannockella kyphosi]
MSDILIEVSNVSKIYDQDILLKRGTNFYALNNVNFVLERGDFIAIMGPSGSGKSTLLNCMSSLDAITKGTIELKGKNLGAYSNQELSDFRYHDLGFIFQNHNLISTLSIFDNIASTLYLGGQDSKDIYKRVLEIAEQLDIMEILKKKPNECSGGQRQRAAIARGLINNPDILICDEPTGNLDSKNSHEFLKLLTDLNEKGTSIVLVTHDSMIASYAKKLVYLRDGQVHHIVERKDSSQDVFFQQINSITNKDSLVHLFGKSEEVELRSDLVTDVSVHGEGSRYDVYAIFNENPEELEKMKFQPCLQCNHEVFEYVRTGEKIYVKDIKKVELFMISKLVMMMIAEYHFYVLVKIHTESTVYDYRFLNENNLTEFFQILLDNNIEIDDPMELIDLFKKNSGDFRRLRYLQSKRKVFVDTYGMK